MQVERFSPRTGAALYANSHTEASYCGGSILTWLRRDARAVIAACCGALTLNSAVIFAGAGATAGINRLVSLLGVGTEALATGRRVAS